VVETVVTRGAPHHLMADGPLLAHRRTRAGDAWELARLAPDATAESGPGAGGAARPAVVLGMPSLRQDRPVAAESTSAVSLGSAPR
jgi:tRNA-2-methylthio-N6-dimethylallyladenosine synthase